MELFQEVWGGCRAVYVQLKGVIFSLHFTGWFRAVSVEFSLSIWVNLWLQFIVYTQPMLQIQFKWKQSARSWHLPPICSSSCLMVAMLGTLLQRRLQAVVNILIVLSFTFAHFGSLVNANAVSLMQSQDDLWFQSYLLSECISFAANDLLLVDGKCWCVLLSA